MGLSQMNMKLDTAPCIQRLSSKGRVFGGSMLVLGEGTLNLKPKI